MARYTVEIGGEWVELPSVTEILGLLDKPALKQWAANCAVEWIRNGGDIDEAAMAWKNVSQDALDVGSFVHHAIEEHIAGRRPSFAGLTGTPLREARVSYRSFLLWARENNPVWIASEVAVHHGKYYAGKLDAIAKIGDEYYIVDFKTSKEVYHEYFIQLAMYRECLKSPLNRKSFQYLDWERKPRFSEIPEIFDRISPKIGVLRVPKDGTRAKWKTIDDLDEIAEKTLAGLAIAVAFYGLKKRRLKNNKMTAEKVAKLLNM